MKRSFDELAGLDQDVIMQKSHIVQSTLDDVINRRFEKFNPVKAKGIATTLEKDFNIDMSEWLSEYNAFKAEKIVAVPAIDKAALNAIQENKLPKKKITTIAAFIAAFSAVVFLFVTSNPFSGLIKEQNMTDEQYKSELNRTEEQNVTNAILSQTDSNVSALPNVSMPSTQNDSNSTIYDVNKSVQTASVQTVAAKPAETNKTVQAIPAQAAAQSGKIYLETNKKLWYKIKYLDNNQTDESTIDPGKLEIDGSRSKIIILGHQQVKISFGQTIIESKAGPKVRYLLKDKKLAVISEEEEYRLLGKSMPKAKAVEKPQ